MCKQSPKFPQAILLAAVSIGGAFAQNPVAPTAGQMNFLTHLIRQMAGVGRPTEQTARRQHAFITMSGLGPQDATILVASAAAYYAAVNPLYQQVSAIIAKGSDLTPADKSTVISLNSQADKLTQNTTLAFYGKISPQATRQLLAIAARDPANKPQ
jgi:hypothetical protein